MPDIAVIIASTREGGLGTTVGRWFLERIGRRADLNVDVIDLGRTPLPPLRPMSSGGAEGSGGAGRPEGEGSEGEGSGGAGASGGAGSETRELAARIGAADGFVVITPEYNHGYPAALKLVIDSVRHEWAAKPVGYVSYGGRSGGLHAVEQLRLVFAELHVVSLRDTVSLQLAHGRSDAAGRQAELEGAEGAVKVMLDQLTWWATTLREGRAARPYIR
ncbi:NADPH-dependent FMN reductase [Streptosporangium sp. NPDC003464]